MARVRKWCRRFSFGRFRRVFCFAKKRWICRGVSTSVEREQAGQDGRVGQETGDRRGIPDEAGWAF